MPASTSTELSTATGVRRAPERRTQAQRRDATRTALLEATLACLVESGYAGVTTGRVAERAGVSRGAQLRYFATKAELVSAAVHHLSQRLSSQLLTTPKRPGSPDAIDGLLEDLWAFHTSPVFVAVVELWLGARTDPDRRELNLPLEAEVYDATRAAARAALPGFDDDPRAAAILNTTLSTMRGLAMLTLVYDEPIMTREWQAHKRDLLLLWSAGSGVLKL